MDNNVVDTVAVGISPQSLGLFITPDQGLGLGPPDSGGGGCVSFTRTHYILYPDISLDSGSYFT